MRTVDVVGAVIVNEKNEVLCALRSAGMSMPGLWEFPGGKVEAGEDPREGLVREILEELGCGIEVGEMVADTWHQYPGVLVHLQTYWARVVSGEPRATEHERIVWLPVARLRGLDWAAADVATVEWVVGRGAGK